MNGESENSTFVIGARTHGGAIVALLGLGLVVDLVGQASTGFQGTDEMRYAEVAKEVGPGRDLFLLHYNTERYSAKPPLYFWAVAACYRLLGGVSPLGLRLPGIVAAILSLGVVYAMAFRLLGRVSLAFLSAAVLMIMPRFIWFTRWGRLDIPMCLFVYGAMGTFVWRYQRREPRLTNLFFWMCVGLSLAIKGPPGAVVIFGSIASFLLWQREGRQWRRVAHGPGIALALAINLAWIAPIFLWGDEQSSRAMFYGETVGRIVDPEDFAVAGHIRGPWYYLVNIWYDAFPAMIFLVAGALTLWRARKRRAEERSLLGLDPAIPRFLLSWFLFTFVFFTLYPPKRVNYLLPAYPAIAIFAVAFLAELQERFKSARNAAPACVFTVPAYLTFIPLALALGLALWRKEAGEGLGHLLGTFDAEAALKLEESNVFAYGPYDLALATQIAGSFLAAAVAVAGFVFIRRRRAIATMGLVAGVMYGLLLVFFAWVVPPVFDDADLRRYAREIESKAATTPDLALASLGSEKPFYSLYGDFAMRRYDDKDDEAFAAYVEPMIAAGRPVMLFVHKDSLKDVRERAWYAGLSRRRDTIRGDPVYVLESPRIAKGPKSANGS